MPGKTSDQVKRKLLIFLIIAPGVFFIAYWLATQTDERVTGHTVELPHRYISLGERVEVQGEYYQVLGGQNIFIDTVNLSNNTAVAEPGRVFVGLVLLTEAKVDKNDVKIIDTSGVTYNPLDVDNAVVVNNFDLPGNGGYPYMFKVSASPDHYYIRIAGDERLTWRFDNNYQRIK